MYRRSFGITSWSSSSSSVVVVVVLLLLTDVPSGGFASLLANEMGIKQDETQVIIRGAHSWVLSCSESSIYRQVSINWEW